MGHHLCRWKTVRRRIGGVGYLAYLRILFGDLFCTCVLSFLNFFVACRDRLLSCLPPEESKHSCSHCRLSFFSVLDGSWLRRRDFCHFTRWATPTVTRILFIDVFYFLVWAIHVLGRVIIWSRQYHIAMVLVAFFLVVRQVDIWIMKIIILTMWLDS